MSSFSGKSKTLFQDFIDSIPDMLYNSGVRSGFDVVREEVKRILQTLPSQSITIDELDDLLIKRGVMQGSFLPSLVDIIQSIIENDVRFRGWVYIRTPATSRKDEHWGCMYPYNVEQSRLENRTIRAFEERIGQDLVNDWCASPVNNSQSPDHNAKVLNRYIRKKAAYYWHLDKIRCSRNDTPPAIMDRFAECSSALQSAARDCRELKHHVFKYCAGHRRDPDLFGDEECPLCLEPIINDNKVDCDVWIYDCGHLLHYRCRGEFYIPCPFRCVGKFDHVD